MSFLAIVRATPAGRVAKYAEFATLSEAEAHVVEYGGFAAEKPDAPWPDWKIDMQGKSISIEPSPPPPPPKDPPHIEAIKRLAVATGIDISDLGL